MGWVITTIARVTAGCLGLFTALNILASGRHVESLNSLWVDLAYWPKPLRDPLLLVAALLLITFSAVPPRRGLRRVLTAGVAVLLALSCMANAWAVVDLVRSGSIFSKVPIPLSAGTAGALALIATAALHPAERAPGPGPAAVSLTTLAALVIGFPLAQMFAFGSTDYRRGADAVVVFGSRVFVDGRLSSALVDRMQTAVELIHEGYAEVLVVSGGPGDGDVHETEAMRDFALAEGLTSDQIVLDEAGWSTRETVLGTLPLMAERGWRRILAVSHSYHLPRIKLTYQLAGLDVWTVPATETAPLRRMPYFMAREVAAYWAYWVRSLLT